MHAARKVAKVVLFTVCFALGLILTQTPVSEPDVRNVTSLEVHPLYAKGTPQALVAEAVAKLEPDTLGWRYVGVVHVYDGTGGAAPWKVPEAVAEWSARTGLTTAMTTDPTSAQIAVYVVDQFTSTNAGGALGVAYYPPRTDGIATGQCRVELGSWVAWYGVTAEHTAIHELGHCLGLGHDSVDKRTVMAPSVQLYDGYTKPQAADIRNLRTLYP